jgi:probable rRNA maturation factor
MLKVTIERERGVRRGFFVSAWIRKAVAASLESEGIGRDAEVSVLLTDDEGIKTINQAYREKDAPTDVLSFPANELQKPLKEALLAGFEPEKDVKSGRLFLGDIVISMERAASQAKEYGHTLKREVSFLTAHSMLHLMGYDHMEEKQENVMREKQRAIMDRMKIKR